MACIGDFYDYHYKIKGYDHIVVLTQEDKKDNWDDQPHVSVIPNPISFTSNHILAELEEKKAITMGHIIADLKETFRSNNNWTLVLPQKL